MDFPLIELEIVPIKMEWNITPSHMEQVQSTVEMEISRDKGGLQIKSSPIRINIDTFEARNSVSPTLNTALKQQAQKGKQIAYEATAEYAKRGQLLLKAKIGEELVTQFAEQKRTKNHKPYVGLDFTPDKPPEISWEKGNLEIRYQMDKLSFDWRISGGDFNFTPGDIEFTVTQRPDILIRYIGGPIYVPPSADPDYVPLDARA